MRRGLSDAAVVSDTFPLAKARQGSVGTDVFLWNVTSLCPQHHCESKWQPVYHLWTKWLLTQRTREIALHTSEHDAAGRIITCYQLEQRNYIFFLFFLSSFYSLVLTVVIEMAFWGKQTRVPFLILLDISIYAACVWQDERFYKL